MNGWLAYSVEAFFETKSQPLTGQKPASQRLSCSSAPFKVTAWLPWLPLACVGSLRNQLIFVTVMPVTVIIVALAATAALACFRMGAMPISCTALLYEITPFAVVWTFLVFPSVSSLGFRALAPCDCFSYEVQSDGGQCVPSILNLLTVLSLLLYSTSMPLQYLRGTRVLYVTVLY